MGRPPSISRAGAGACVTPSVQAAARVFRPPGDDHAQPGGPVEPLGDVLADDVQSAAAGAGLALRLDDDLFARQVIEVFVAARAAFALAFGFERRIGLLVLGLGLGERVSSSSRASAS